MKLYFTNILNGKIKLHPFNPINLLLHCISLPYLLIVTARRFLYKKNVFKANKLRCPVISVGNLTLGGTGKTPVVAYIAHFLIDKGFKPLVLARGYGRSVKTNIAIVSNGKNILLKPEESGDEPYLLAENIPSLQVIVGKNRFQAGEHGIQRFKPDVIILDDGFQHLPLARDMNIVLLNRLRSIENSHIFPAGSLREPVSALKCADIILYTHSDESMDSSYDNLFVKDGTLKLKCIHTFDKIVRLKDNKIKSPEELNKKRTLIFCGIGEPESFKTRIERYKAEVVYFKFYPDHYIYKQRDLDFIHETAEKLDVDFILTTQKDAVKIKGMAAASPLIWTVRLKIEFEEGESQFQEAVLKSCTQKFATEAKTQGSS